MGIWGHGNFQNDAALDYVDELVDQLVKRIESCFEGTNLDPDELGEAELIPSVHILAWLCQETGTVPPEADTVEGWKTRYLNNWDATIDGLDPDPDYKVQRRQTIAETFDRLIALGKDEA
jgi:hypothetical protein